MATGKAPRERCATRVKKRHVGSRRKIADADMVAPLGFFFCGRVKGLEPCHGGVTTKLSRRGRHIPVVLSACNARRGVTGRTAPSLNTKTRTGSVVSLLKLGPLPPRDNPATTAAPRRDPLGVARPHHPPSTLPAQRHTARRPHICGPGVMGTPRPPPPRATPPVPVTGHRRATPPGGRSPSVPAAENASQSPPMGAMVSSPTPNAST